MIEKVEFKPDFPSPKKRIKHSDISAKVTPIPTYQQELSNSVSTAEEKPEIVNRQEEAIYVISGIWRMFLNKEISAGERLAKLVEYLSKLEKTHPDVVRWLDEEIETTDGESIPRIVQIRQQATGIK